MRRTKKVAVCFTLLLGMVMGVTVANAAESAAGAEATVKTVNVTEPNAAALADEPCFANKICVYKGRNYTNAWYYANCSVSGEMLVFEVALRSVKNRCGNKSNKLFNVGTLVACMNPGGNRPNPGVFDRIWIPSTYGSVC